MKKVWEVCELSDDIKFGTLDENKFAVELYSVLEGKADEIYLNSDLFFKNTFLTKHMRYVIIQILKRLSSSGGSANLILSNEFGGGKTHTLLLVYHILTNKEGLGFEYIRKYEIDKELDITGLPRIDIVSIDCRTLGDEITLWGKIAKDLHMYDKIKKYDKQKTPPPVDILTEILGKPVLLLIDEVYYYLKNARGIPVGKANLCELTLNFLLSLMSAIQTTKNSQLLLSTTGEQYLYQEEAQDFSDKIDLMNKLRDVTSRLGTYIFPVEPLEIYDIVRTRLIKQESIREEERDITITNFSEYYDRRFSSNDYSYREKMKKAYPFHPTIIDILYQRVSTIREFNKTRGILRFLGLILKSVFVKRHQDAYFIMTNHIRLSREIADEIAFVVWHEMGTKDVRDALQLAKLVRSIDDVDKTARTIMRYKPKILNPPSASKLK